MDVVEKKSRRIGRGIHEYLNGDRNVDATDQPQTPPTNPCCYEQPRPFRLKNLSCHPGLRVARPLVCATGIALNLLCNAGLFVAQTEAPRCATEGAM